MTQTAVEKLAEEVNAFMKENLKPELLVEIVTAADSVHIYEQDRINAITKAVMGLAGTLLAIQRVEIQEDKIEGLESDLESAVQVAYDHGAEEWARLNYPSWMERLEANKRTAREVEQC
ncbi:hypothetical protein GOB57_24330 [Sinorhizobium meliloti]|nr:hypothetical protein [Sinorhizobium meliloti]